MTSIPASAASGADSAAQMSRVSPCRRAPSATAIVPATGRTRPSSESSPTQPCSSSRSGESWCEPASSASAMGRSKPEPSLRSAAGARLTVIRLRPGHGSIALTMPLCTRCFASWQARSASPTIENAGQVGRDEVRLDLDAARLEADDGGGEGSREHTTDGTGQPCTCLAESGRKCAGLQSRRRGSGRGDDENRLEVLAGAPPRAAVDVPLVPVDETEVGPAQDLGIEIAAIVDDDAHPAAERERRRAFASTCATPST